MQKYVAPASDERALAKSAAAGSGAYDASGVDLTLDIVGFTITGKKVEAGLGALAEATGGHYYPAGDGDARGRGDTGRSSARGRCVVAGPPGSTRSTLRVYPACPA